MFCTQCGSRVTENAMFCTQCGSAVQREAAVTTKKPIDNAALKRRVNRLIDTFDPTPYLSYTKTAWFIDEFRYYNADNFDPFYRLTALRSCVTDCILEATAYQCEEKELQRIIDETYGVRLISLKESIRDYLFSSFDSAIKQIKFHYNDMLFLRSEEFLVYFYARSLTTVCCDLRDCAGLLKTRLILSQLNSFYCEKNDAFASSQIIKSGHMLSLPQFATEKRVYDSLMTFLEDTAIKLNPEAREFIEKDKKELADQNKKAKRQTVTSILIRIALALLSPIMMLLNYHVISPLLEIDFAKMATGLVIIVGAVLCIATIVCNIILKKLPIVIIADIVICALLYPICWITTAAIQIAVVALIIFVLFMGSILRSD